MFIDFTPVRVVAATRKLRSSVGVEVRQNRRNYWGIAYKRVGVTYYRQNGKQFLSDKNHLLLLPKNGQYAWECVEPGECILIDFEGEGAGNEIQSVEIGDGGEFLSAFSALERCMSPESPVAPLEAMQHLYGILVILMKAAHKKYVPKEKHRRLAPAMDAMLERYSDPGITNESLARLCGMSVVYFRKCFESVYGDSPIRYLHRLRMEKAKGMLLSDYDSISQIAESVGYGSIYHFSKMFRSYVGVSPTAFAASSRKE